MNNTDNYFEPLSHVSFDGRQSMCHRHNWSLQEPRCTVDGNWKTEQNTDMMAKAERMKSELAGLAPEDRAELLRFLIESLDGDEEQGVAAAWDVELKRRADEIQSGRVTGEPAEKLLREMRTKSLL